MSRQISLLRSVVQMKHVFLFLLIITKICESTLGNDCRDARRDAARSNNGESDDTLNNFAEAVSWIAAVGGIAATVASGGAALPFVLGVSAGVGGVISDLLFEASNAIASEGFDYCIIADLAQQYFNEQYRDKWGLVVDNARSHSVHCQYDTATEDCYDNLKAFVANLAVWRLDFSMTDSDEKRIILYTGLYANMHLIYFDWYRASANQTGHEIKSSEWTAMVSSLEQYIEDAYKYFGDYLVELTQDIPNNRPQNSEIGRRYSNAWSLVGVLDWLKVYEEMCDNHGHPISDTIQEKILAFPNNEAWQFVKGRGQTEIGHGDPLKWGTFGLGSWRQYFPPSPKGGIKSFQMRYEGTQSGYRPDSLGTIAFLIKPKASPSYYGSYRKWKNHPLQKYAKKATVKSCPSGSYIAGYELLIQQIFQGSYGPNQKRDRRAVEGIKVICRNEVDWTFQSFIVEMSGYKKSKSNVAKWYKWEQCPPGTFVQQMREKIDSGLTAADDTGLNNIKVRCSNAGMSSFSAPIAEQRSCMNQLFSCAMDSNCGNCAEAYANGAVKGDELYELCESECCGAESCSEMVNPPIIVNEYPDSDIDPTIVDYKTFIAFVSSIAFVTTMVVFGICMVWWVCCKWNGNGKTKHFDED